MPIRGRKPKPVEVRMREGNPQHEPMPEPMLVAGRPDPDTELEPPEDLSKDGKYAWATVVPMLAEVGLLDRVDRLALEAMCIAWGRAKQAGKVIAMQGHLVKGAGGTLRPHPSLQIERQSLQLFNQFAEQYALTPAARTRLGLAELHRRQLKAEFDSALGEVELVPVDAVVVEEEDGPDAAGS